MFRYQCSDIQIQILQLMSLNWDNTAKPSNKGYCPNINVQEV